MLCTVLFLTFLDNTIISVALADIQNNSGLNASIGDLQWIVEGYMLAFAALMLAGGTLGDLLGRRAVMLAGVVVFIVGSLVGGFSPDIADWLPASWGASGSSVLIAGRVVMGIGAAASEPGTLSMIRHLFPDRAERAQAIGAWAAVSGVALALGPILGGVLIGLWGWRAIFFFNVVFGFGALVAGMMTLPESADRQGRRFDPVGLTLGAVALAVGTYAAIHGETAGYGSTPELVLFAAAGVTAAAFVWWERRAADPMLPVQLFRNPSFTGANLVALATNYGVFVVFFFTTLYLQEVSTFTGYDIAIQFISLAAAMATAAPVSGWWVARSGPLVPTVLGCLLSGGGLLIVDSQISATVTLAQLAWPLAIVGFGFGLTLVTMTSTVLSVVPGERSGMAASTVNAFRELGGVIGVVAMGTFVYGTLIPTAQSKMDALGVPAAAQAPVINALVTGKVPGNGSGGAQAAIKGLPADEQKTAEQVLQSVYSAFKHSLDVALLTGAGLLLVSAVAAYFLLRRTSDAPADSEVQFGARGESPTTTLSR